MAVKLFVWTYTNVEKLPTPRLPVPLNAVIVGKFGPVGTVVVTSTKPENPFTAFVMS